MTKAATLSPCRRYRYELWRRWSDAPPVVFIGLNPSTADETQDDATIRKCIAYAKKWGHGALCMVNLFAFRATQPKDMLAEDDPVGPDNDRVLQSLAWGCPVVIAAWGAHGSHRGRDKQVLGMLPTLYALYLTKDGKPGHPLYLKGDAVPFLLQVDDPYEL